MQDFSTLYVGNFPPYIKEEQISEHFSKHGFGDNVVRVTIFSDKVTHKSKGCGIVTVTPATIAESAIHALNGTLLCGKHQLAVSLYQQNRKSSITNLSGATPKQPLAPEKHYTAGRLAGMGTFPQSNPSVSSMSGEVCKVFVNSSPPFSNDINSSHLQKHFDQFKGEISNVQIIRDQETKQTKGYGIITFSSPSTAENAMQIMNSSWLHGKFCIKLHSDRQSGRQQRPPPSANLHPQAQGMGQASDGFQPTGISITDAGHFLHQSNVPPTPQLHSPPAAASNALVVENLNPVISEDEIKAVLRLPISSCIFEVTGPDRKKAKIQCQVPSDASAAVVQLDGKQLLGHTVHAYLLQQLSLALQLPSCKHNLNPSQ